MVTAGARAAAAAARAVQVPGATAAPLPAALTPVRVPSAVDEVVDRLLTSLALGELVPGQRLPPERELSRLLGVSRTTVSEALSRLRAAGVLQVRRGRSGGSFVQDSWHELSAGAIARTLVPRRAELAQLCDLRCRWEETVARTAAERRTERQARALEADLERFAQSRTPEQQHASDIALHAGVLDAARNDQMARLSQDLLARLAAGTAVEPFDERFYARALREHGSLVRAVVERRVEDAGQIARRHFTMSARTLEAVLSRAVPDEPV